MRRLKLPEKFQYGSTPFSLQMARKTLSDLLNAVRSALGGSSRRNPRRRSARGTRRETELHPRRIRSWRDDRQLSARLWFDSALFQPSPCADDGIPGDILCLCNARISLLFPSRWRDEFDTASAQIDANYALFARLQLSPNFKARKDRLFPFFTRTLADLKMAS